MVTAAEVDRWLSTTDPTDEARDEIALLAQTVASEVVPWRRATRRTIPDLQRDVAAVEASAGAIRSFNPVLVPGLLQTADYMRRVMAAFEPQSPARLDAGVAARMERQEILYDPGKRIDFVIGEAALRWALGPPRLMLAQLNRIASMLALPHLSIGLLPLAREIEVWHSHAFTLYEERGDEPALVYVEMLVGGFSPYDQADVERCREAFAQLQAVADHGAEAGKLLGRLMDELRALLA